jgi:membrane protein DedA with SNARE-associated domain
MDFFQHYLQIAQPYLQHYGYFAVFGMVLVEGFGFPAPGETVIIAGALLASEGHMNIAVLTVVAWSAAVIGDNIGFVIGHFGGRRLVLHKGRYIGVSESHLQKVEHFFSKWGGGLVILARFVDVLRQLNGVVAGIGGMPWWRFLLFNAIGAALWVGAWGLGVYYLGRHMEQVADWFSRLQPYLIAIGIISLLSVIIYLLRRSKS